MKTGENNDAKSSEIGPTGANSPPPPAHGQVCLIGVGHIIDTYSTIRDLILGHRPTVVCLELDRMRLEALFQKKREDMSENGGKKEAHGKGKNGGEKVPRIMELLAKQQEKLGQIQGHTPGEEMLVAFQAAMDVGAEVALIDMDILDVSRRFLREMRIREKAYLFFSTIASFFIPRKKIEREIEDVLEDPDTYIEELGRKLPTAKKVLIDDRNRYMAQKIAEFAGTGEKVVAVVGDGHIPGLAAELEKMGVHPVVHRLRDMRTIGSGARVGARVGNGNTAGDENALEFDGSSVTFTVQISLDNTEEHEHYKHSE